MTYIIAEAGTNHAHENEHERFYLAQRLIFAAANAGADAVKFQLFVPDEELFCPIEGDEKRWERWNTTLLNLDLWKKLRRWSESVSIDLIFSAFQRTGVNWASQLEGKYYKVASRAIDRYPYEMVPGPFLISNGMMRAPFVFVPKGQTVHLLNCISKYPVPLEEARWVDGDGLSDHSGTVWPGLDAISRGAKFLEVHFRMDGCNAGPDLPVCLSLDNLKLLCEARDAFAAMQAHPV
jgi:N,N'-diacetyllegionaminate synthase